MSAGMMTTRPWRTPRSATISSAKRSTSAVLPLRTATSRQRPDDLNRVNGVMRYSSGSYDNGFAVTAMAYSGDWFATTSVPSILG